MLKKILLCLCLTASNLSLAKTLALSFDDGLDPATNPAAEQVNTDILNALKDHQVLAILYPSLSKVGEQQGMELVTEWGKQGHRIGNHSNLHLNLHHPQVSLADYLTDVQQAHGAFATLQGFVARYRFPYLKEGDTLEKREGVREWLASNSYQSGAVSIDASDWYYNQLFVQYQQANDQASLDKLKPAYIQHLLDRAEYYDQLALTTIEYSPKHVLLLHVREINAAWLADVISAFKQQGWEFIDSDTAYQDPLYQQQPKLLPAGESIIWNLAKQQGNQDLRYPAEDAPYEHANLKEFGLEVER